MFSATHKFGDQMLNTHIRKAKATAINPQMSDNSQPAYWSDLLVALGWNNTTDKEINVSAYLTPLLYSDGGFWEAYSG